MSEFREVASALADWIFKHGIVQNGAKVTIEFVTEHDAARAAFYVKREFERDSLVPDVLTAGLATFKAHGIAFELTARPAPGDRPKGAG